MKGIISFWKAALKGRGPRELHARLRGLDQTLGRTRVSDFTYMIILAVIVGLVGGFGAIVFRLMIRFFQVLFFGLGPDFLTLLTGLPWYHKILAPAAGGALVGPIVYFLAREAKGHGVPEVIAAVATEGSVIRPRVVLVKILASAICIGSGGSVGREGPIVQIGSAMGSSMGQFLRLSSARLRTLVGCGAAAGIAATFNAPIAGPLFALEIIVGDFGLTSFSPIVISSVTATYISRLYLGNHPAFSIPAYSLVSAWEIPMYAVLGLIAGLVALLFIVSLYWMEDRFEALPFPEYLKPILGGLILGALAIWFPHVFGVGYETISLSLMGKFSLLFLLALGLAKIFATSLTLGSGGSGGIFAPSLFIGAMIGGLFGSIVHSLFPEITASSGAYALVGMGAIVAAATHAPITAIVIIFEMTGDYLAILPLMASCIISVLITTSLKDESIYTLKLIRRGQHITRLREVSILRSLLVKDVMREDVLTIPKDMPFRELLDRALNSEYSYFPVVESRGELSGIFSLSDLFHALRKPEVQRDGMVAADLGTTRVLTVTPLDDLDKVLERFGRINVEELPVVSSEADGKVIGRVSMHDLMEAYRREVLRRSAEGG